MSYATVVQLRLRLGTRTCNEIYSDDIAPQSDLESAAAEIDGAIALRYMLPVTAERSAALLTDWTLTLAEERAYARCGGSAYPDMLKERVAQVRRYLDMIREDRFKLPDAAEKGGSSGAGGIALVKCDAPVFGRDRMEGL